MKYSTQSFPKPVRKARPRRRGSHPPARSPDSGATAIQTEHSFPRNPPVFSAIADLISNSSQAFEHSSYKTSQNEQDHEGKTQLHRATLGQDTEQVRILLHAGAAVDIQDYVGNTPLHYAAAKNDADIVQLLLRFGAEVNGKGHLGRSPLHMVVPDLHLISSLLGQGADPSQQDDRGDTPLHLAISFAWSETSGFRRKLVDFFLTSGSDPNRANKDGVTPFLRLLDQPHADPSLCLDIRSFLERGASILKALPDGRTPLQLFLCLSGKEVFLRENNSLSRARNNLLRSFLDKGVSIMTPTQSGQPLILEYFQKHRHAWRADLELGEKLCRLIPSDDASGIGSLVLHEVASRPRYGESHATEGLIQILLQKGADPNHQNPQKETPLILLFERVAMDPSFVTKLAAPLLARGADPWQMDSSGKCAIFEAEKMYPSNGHAPLRAMLGSDLRLQDSPSTRDSTNTVKRECWEGWEQAATAVDWNEAKRHILHQPINPSKKIGSVLRDSAFAVLAEKHVHLAREKFQGEHGEVELRRRYVAGVFRDCRERGISIHSSCTDYLIELCLE